MRLTLLAVIHEFSSGGRFDHRFNINVETDMGAVIIVTVRWGMCRRSDEPHNWSISRSPAV